LKKILSTIGLIVIIFSLAACGQEAKETPKKTDEQSQNGGDSAINDDKKGAISSNSFFEPFMGNIDHIHGIGYAGNQNAVFFAAHDGLKIYEYGKWYKTKKENNDYMGFNATEQGFYSSGHPGVDSKLPNPIGIKKSTDNGESIEDIALEGETDFHVMGVGYRNNAIFVLNPEKNSLMESNKFYRSEDGGETWSEANVNGLNDEILSVALHPDKAAIIAAAGKNGIYLSKDKGENFDLITKDMQGTSVFFTEDSLWYGSYSGKPKLVKRSLNDETEKEVALPEMKQDAVLYFAVNPQNEEEMTFVSFNGSIYQTTDGAETWKHVVAEGKLQ
jgi:predicted small lipoprotein YifL